MPSDDFQSSEECNPSACVCIDEGSKADEGGRRHVSWEGATLGSRRCPTSVFDCSCAVLGRPESQNRGKEGT